jgi:hypothetical protein
VVVKVVWVFGYDGKDAIEKSGGRTLSSYIVVCLFGLLEGAISSIEVSVKFICYAAAMSLPECIAKQDFHRKGFSVRCYPRAVVAIGVKFVVLHDSSVRNPSRNCPFSRLQRLYVRAKSDF